ncbi:protein HAIKU1-like [Silene latifolia]|uniref:protein HAIKU1-like n=1 Tax=Silene latifolia TaxID=37657 RepID=UPI003D76BD99
MDNSNSNISRNRQNEFLGVNKIGKNIRKISGANYNNIANNIGNSGANYSNNNNGVRQKPQPQVYNISKNDFRNIVQQLTASRPRPPTNPPKHPNMRLQRFRPPPLSPINCSLLPHVVATQVHMAPPESHFNNSNSNSSSFGGPPTQFGHGQASWTTPALSPISAYVQQLQSCIGDEGPRPGEQPMQTQMTGQISGQHSLQQQFQQTSFSPVHNPNVPTLPSPGANGPTRLPSATSQFLLPYPLLSPGSQFPPPLSPNFAVSSFGFFSPGSQPLLSPGISFPLSPSGFFPVSSPRWRDQ